MKISKVTDYAALTVGARGNVCHIFSKHGPLRGPRVSLLLVYNWVPIFFQYISFSLLHSYIILTKMLFNGFVGYADHKQ